MCLGRHTIAINSQLGPYRIPGCSNSEHSRPPTSRSRSGGADLHGQTAIIAGSNTGVGFETARQLLELGPTRLILAVRDEIKGKAAASRLSEAHKLAEGTAIEVWPLDLSLYESVTAFAQLVWGPRPAGYRQPQCGYRPGQARLQHQHRPR